MNRVNYQRELEHMIDDFTTQNRRPSLLLHSCCAPCSSYCLEYLSQYFDITVYYYNPNITSQEEYHRRVEEQKRLIKEFPGVTFREGPYDRERFYQLAKGLEDIPEGGERCFRCYELRLLQAAYEAAAGGYDYFTTTLSISPLKNSDRLNEIGRQAAEKAGAVWLPSDFKKKNGYKRSVELSAQYGLYRQDYCGCEYSKAEADRRRSEKDKGDKNKKEENTKAENTKAESREESGLAIKHLEQRVIVCDLDNTLLTTEKQLTLHTRKVLGECQARGMKIVIDSARPPRAVTEYRALFPFDAAVLYNGGWVECMPQGAGIPSGGQEPVFRRQREIAHGSAEDFLKRVLERYVRCPRISVEVDNVCFANFDVGNTEYVLYDAFPRIPQGRVMKIHVWIEMPSMVEQVKGLLSDDIYMSVAAGRVMQIMSREATKWQGLCCLLDYWQIGPEQVIYFGDDQDDVEPIIKAGTGVAMANGIEPARQAADVITGYCDEEGVASYLSQYVL